MPVNELPHRTNTHLLTVNDSFATKSRGVCLYGAAARSPASLNICSVVASDSRTIPVLTSLGFRSQHTNVPNVQNTIEAADSSRVVVARPRIARPTS